MLLHQPSHWRRLYDLLRKYRRPNQKLFWQKERGLQEYNLNPWIALDNAKIWGWILDKTSFPVSYFSHVTKKEQRTKVMHRFFHSVGYFKIEARQQGPTVSEGLDHHEFITTNNTQIQGMWRLALDFLLNPHKYKKYCLSPKE